MEEDYYVIKVLTYKNDVYVNTKYLMDSSLPVKSIELASKYLSYYDAEDAINEAMNNLDKNGLNEQKAFQIMKIQSTLMGTVLYNL